MAPLSPVAGEPVAVVAIAGIDTVTAETSFQTARTEAGGEVTYSLQSLLSAMSVGAGDDELGSVTVSFMIRGCGKSRGLRASSSDRGLRPHVTDAHRVGPGFKIEAGRETKDPPFVYGSIDIDTHRALDLKTPADVVISSELPRCRTRLLINPDHVQALQAFSRKYAREHRSFSRPSQ